MFGSLLWKTGHWSTDLSDPTNSYTGKQILVIISVNTLSLLRINLHKLLVGLIVCDCKFQIRLVWHLAPCQFYLRQVSGSKGS